MPVGIIATAIAGWAAARAFSGSPGRTRGALVGAALGLAGSWPVLLLVPETVFESVGVGGAVCFVTLLAAALAGAGGAVGDVAGPRVTSRWWAVALCFPLVAAGIMMRETVRAHITPARVLQAANDAHALRTKVQRHADSASVAAYIETDPVAALRSTDLNTRYGAALTLAQRGDRRAQPVLVEAVRSDKWLWTDGVGGRPNAARELGRMGGPGAADALIAAAGPRVPEFEPHTFDESTDLCAAALEALGVLGEKRAVPLLMKAVLMPAAPGDTPMWDPIQDAAALALCRVAARHGIEPTLRPLYAALDEPRTRARAQQVFYWLRAPGLWNHREVRAALGSLDRSQGHEDPIMLLQAGSLEERKRAVAGFVRRPPRAAVPALIGALHDGCVSVRAPAAVALGRAGDRRAVPALLAALDDAKLGIERECITALGALRDPRAVPALARRLRDPYRAASAIAALQRIGTPDALAAVGAAERDGTVRRFVDHGAETVCLHRATLQGATVDYVLDRVPGREGGVALLILAPPGVIRGHGASSGPQGGANGTRAAVDVTYWLGGGQTRVAYGVSDQAGPRQQETLEVNGGSRPLSAGRVLLLDVHEGRARVRQLRGVVPRGGPDSRWLYTRDAVVLGAVRRLARSHRQVREVLQHPAARGL